MLGFTKKRFFITLGLAVGIWFISGVIQVLISPTPSSFLGYSCTVTGYPLAKCLSHYKNIEIFSYYLINILFWFFLIHFIGKFVKRS